MPKTEITPWPRDSNKSASGKPGAVQIEVRYAISTDEITLAGFACGVESM
jgi:hypothetical protein